MKDAPPFKIKPKSTNPRLALNFASFNPSQLTILCYKNVSTTFPLSCKNVISKFLGTLKAYSFLNVVLTFMFGYKNIIQNVIRMFNSLVIETLF
ncbi:MAG: hypothetical protein ACRCW3_02175 [Metamycoplasmataceae bacterium]